MIEEDERIVAAIIAALKIPRAPLVLAGIGQLLILLGMLVQAIATSGAIRDRR